MKKKYTFAANWKMALSYSEAVSFARDNKPLLVQLAQETNHEIIVCSGMMELSQVAQTFVETGILCGAQDCSDHEKGAYTGQVSLKSIKEAGATHCIIGHSERRKYNGETNDAVSQKTMLALEHRINPIICIGELLEEYDAGKTLDVLSAQLEKVIASIRNSSPDVQLYIAYEPVWAIGTGKVPTVEDLELVFTWLQNYLQKKLPLKWRLLYGGSVSEKTISIFDKIKSIDGFLIGGASLDIQAFKKIVSYFS